MKQAIILCGGNGTRLKPLTDTTHKTMIKINNKPNIEHKLEILEKYIDEVILIIGPKKEQIQKHYGENFKNLKIKYIEQKEPLGTGHAVLQAKEILKDQFLVINGDDIFSEETIKQLLESDLAIAGYETQTPEKFGILETDENSNLLNVEEKPLQPKTNLANIGLYSLNKKIFEHQIQKSPRGEYEIIDYLNYLIQTGEKIKVIPTSFWLPVGNIEELQKAEQYFSTSQKPYS